MGRLNGKVALITGAARGQGRSHAATLARQGADLAICDIAADELEAARADLERETGRRVISAALDVRDADAMDKLVERAADELGRLDVVVANAAVFNSSGRSWELTPAQWAEMIDINLNGAWNTVRACVPTMIAKDEGGSIILTGSGSSVVGFRNTSHYNAAKHGIIGLMRTLANEVAPYRIRVNAVSPSSVNTSMIMNPATFEAFAGGKEGATLEDAMPGFLAQNVLPSPWVEPEDVSNAVLFLASEEARYVTGVDLPVDCGTRIQPAGMPPSALAASAGAA
jgi:SDR family mycofactocin-dependent oxidoreductase